MGAQNSELGYPISDELTTPDGIGRYNFFEDGAIYWAPQYGAHAVHGPVMKRWSESGYETGPFGYPTGDQTNDSEWKVRQVFERGEISVFNTVITRLGQSFDLNDQETEEMLNVLLKDFAENGLDSKAGFDALLKRSLESLEENHRYLLLALAATPALRAASNSENEAAGCKYEVPGSSSTKRGDVFYSVATTYSFNHGHNGIFVREGSGPAELETIEAVNPEAGVQRLRGSERLGVCDPHLLRGRTDDSTRNSAAAFAEAQVGKGYNSKFFATRIGSLEKSSYNCSQLVWAAYKRASGGGLDIGERYPYEPYSAAVFPLDIYKSHNTYEYY